MSAIDDTHARPAAPELPPTATLMKAIVQETFGSPDVLELAEIEVPVVGEDDVLVRVLAASAHMGDWHFMTGLPYLFRIAGAGLRAPKTRVRGTDLAGRIELVGKNVSQLRPGDEVFGTGHGSFAEYATARMGKLAAKPSNLTFEQAATVPTSGSAALQALDKAKVRSGQKVLIIGAAGGVGSFAVQIAKAFGAHVTGVCGSAKVDLVRSIGADEVIDYTREDFADTADRFDVILDIAGNRSVSHLRKALAPRGTLVIVGGEGGGRWFGGISRQLGAQLLSLFVGQKLGTFIAKPNGEDLVVLRDLIEGGKLTPVVGATYPLSQVPEAIRYLEEGHATGKVVISV